jgi:hypothetical protein
MRKNLNLYLLTNLFDRDWDCVLGCVVRAVNPKHARELASAECGDEGKYVWLSSKTSTCIVIGTASTRPRRLAEVVLRDFKAG